MSGIREQVACASKRFFVDKRASVTALKLALKKRAGTGGPEALRFYHCPNCKGWHLTKKPEEE